MLLSLLDPEGARRRRGRRLRRRIYQNKVSFTIHVNMLLKMELALHFTLLYRDLTLFGNWMVMIS